MTEIVLAFITGLTTGGLSCLAVQGGLLASSVAHQIEKDLGGIETGSGPVKLSVASPILWFLASKLAAYSVLGFLLGWIGSLIQLSPISRAILQIGIGIFMLGQAGRLLKLHPFFRFFNIEPPVFVRKLIRKVSRKGEATLTPIFLGALTVLIPCGITQVMMVTAMASGNPLTGAALMFAFVLGTSPVFFVVAYFTTRLGARLEKYFSRFVAIVVLVLGLVAINTGLNIAGFPYTVERIFNSLQAQPVQALAIVSTDPVIPPPNAITNNLFDNNPSQSRKVGCNCGMMGSRRSENDYSKNLILPALPTEQPATEENNQFNNYTIQVLNTSYSPEVLTIAAGQASQITFNSENVFSCSLAIVIPGLGINITLKPTDSQTIELPALNSGDQLPYSCSMGMFTGLIVAE